ncbi:MAG: IS630 family transposase [Planctomycetales bacterium]|nr:IS630 family transposase [Planctomycetales bacterium]
MLARKIAIALKTPSFLNDQFVVATVKKKGRTHVRQGCQDCSVRTANVDSEKLANSKTAAQRLIQRALIILLAFDRKSNQQIAERVKLNRNQVGIWRRRWQESFDALVRAETDLNGAAFFRMIEDVLSDAPRSGAPGDFSAEQVTQILAVACEKPELSNRPINEWTARELADEVIKRGIVDSISISQVARYLAEADLQPHRSKQWLTTKETDPEVFQQQVETVCQAYLNAPALYFQANTRTISVDEMTGVQALERNAQTIPMQPGQPARIEFEYTRHGTLCLIGNWDVVEGTMISPTIGLTRTEKDFCDHIQQTVAEDPNATWRFIVDNLNTHCSETLVNYVAEVEEILTETLGVKGKSGILKSMKSRMEFLSDVSHQIRFIYLPKHSSWLNQIEIMFGIVQRRVLRRGDFKSLDDLKHRLQEFIAYFNRTFARPFNWTYTGKPVKAASLEIPKTWKEKWRKCKNRKQLALVQG